MGLLCFLTSSVANHRVDPLLQKLGMDIKNNLSGASFFINTIDLKNFHR